METKNLRQVLADFPSTNDRDQFCRPDTKDQCPYFSTKQNGKAQCELNSGSRKPIDEPANCEGTLGIIKTHAKVFTGASFRLMASPNFDIPAEIDILKIEGKSLSIYPVIEGPEVRLHYEDPVVEIVETNITLRKRSMMVESIFIEVPNRYVEIVPLKREQPRLGRFNPRRYLPT